jgi:acetyl-CoA carboxylase carboxyltransferase component
MNRKEEWILKTMESIDDVQPVSVKPELTNKILDLLATQKTGSRQPSTVAKWLVAASIVLLTGINILSMVQCAGKAHSDQQGARAMYSDYFSYLNTLQ